MCPAVNTYNRRITLTSHWCIIWMTGDLMLWPVPSGHACLRLNWPAEGGWSWARFCCSSLRMLLDVWMMSLLCKHHVTLFWDAAQPDTCYPDHAPVLPWYYRSATSFTYVHLGVKPKCTLAFCLHVESLAREVAARVQPASMIMQTWLRPRLHNPLFIHSGNGSFWMSTWGGSTKQHNTQLNRH